MSVNVNMDEFEELLNDCNPTTVLGTYTFYAGTILRKMDPVAFHKEYHTYCAAVEEEMALED